MCKRRNFDKSTYKSYLTLHSDIPDFYHLIKTHKNSPELKIRPIVSNIRGPTKKISWLLVQILRPLLRSVPAHLENSFDLIQRIKNIDLSNNRQYTYPCSFDVVSLYTCIPIQQAIDNVMMIIKELKFHFFGLKNDDIQDLLTVTLTNTYFRYRDSQYQQIKGLPMGSSVSGFLAILFLDTIEKRALRAFPNCILFARYVDDCFALLRNNEDANKLHQVLNSQHPDIKFELETPNEHKLSLLDFTVDMLTDVPTFSFYKKAAKKNLFVHFDSSFPTSMKRATIDNEIKRITERTTSQAELSKEIKRFEDILICNGYPNDFIRKNRKMKKNIVRRNLPVHYISLPFVSDSINTKIKRIFWNEGINLRIYHRNRTLRQVLRKQKPQQACTMKNCPLHSPECYRKLVVYQVTCSCGDTYIGSTKRPLHQRIKEHLRMATSAIFNHRLSCSGSFSTKVLSSAKDCIDLRIREALFISSRRPTLNGRDEGRDICSLIRSDT